MIYAQIALMIVSAVVSIAFGFHWRYFNDTHYLDVAGEAFFGMIITAIVSIVTAIFIFF
jgi:uncharacterized membrane protein